MTINTAPNDLARYTTYGQRSDIWASLVEDHPQETRLAGWNAIAEALEGGIPLDTAVESQLVATANGAGTGRIRGVLEFMLTAIEAYQDKAGKKLQLTVTDDMSKGVRILLESLILPPKMLRAQLTTIPVSDSLSALGALTGIVVAINEKVGGFNIEKRDATAAKGVSVVKAKPHSSTARNQGRTSSQASKPKGMPKLSFGKAMRN
jgi:hypothetical protein